VSTGIAGIPRENNKTHDAVFEPTPGNAVSQFLATLTGMVERKSRSPPVAASTSRKTD
jgi:hypothetical protein